VRQIDASDGVYRHAEDRNDHGAPDPAATGAGRAAWASVAGGPCAGAGEGST
jgi:hypothetical protein